MRSPGLPCPVSLVRAVKVPLIFSRGETEVFDRGAGGGEPGQVAGLSQDARTTKSGQANNRADQLADLQLVENR